MKRWFDLLVPAILLVAALWLRWEDGALVQRLRLLVFDSYQALEPRDFRPAAGQPAPVRIVDIDEASLAAIGQWPWSRIVLADLVVQLQQLGVAAIGFDIIMAEPDRTSPENMIALWRRFPGTEAIAAQIRALPDPDKVLADAAAGVPSVVGYAFTDRPNEVALAPPAGFASAGDDPLRFVAHYGGATPGLPTLERGFAGRGFVNFEPELDGIIRRVPLLAGYRDALYPSFAAEVLRVAQGAGNYTVRASGASGEESFGTATGIVAVKIGAAIVETDATGALILYDSGTRPERFVSALEVLNGTADQALLAGHIVLVGSTAAALRDIRATPLAPNMAGVEVQAQLLEQMIQGQFLHRPDWANGMELVYLALIGVLLIVAIRQTGAAAGAAIALAIAVISAALSWAAFHHARWLVDPISPLIAALAVYIVGSLLGYLRTETERRQNRLVLGQYLPPRLVERYARDMGALRLGGETRELTILFADIRGFTAIAERMAPEALTRLINEFLTPMTRIVQEETGGTIDKYIGDAIMAFWNAPDDDPDHARHALDAALAMRAELERLNARWLEEAEAAGGTFEPLRIGIGINTGRCTVGNFGSDQRFDYSALGDAVNLASRLEGLSRLYGVDVVVGEATARAAAGHALLRIDRVRVRGRAAPEGVYTLLDASLPPETVANLARAFDGFFTFYCAGDWQKAAETLDRLRSIAPSLASLCDLYEDRVRAYRLRPPPADWDGVFVAESKAG
jgi:adenylate cyclase